MSAPRKTFIPNEIQCFWCNGRMNEKTARNPLPLDMGEEKNRGAHGDSSFMLGGLPSSSENPPALAVGSVN